MSYVSVSFMDGTGWVSEVGSVIVTDGVIIIRDDQNYIRDYLSLDNIKMLSFITEDEYEILLQAADNSQ